MAVYYNEFEPFAAAWLRELMKEGLIPYGDVDERSIADIEPADLRGYKQCHFFAGIGGWPCALRLAGWDDDRPVWTGSCPCQPFSSAGKQTGKADERHLWPVWNRLIRECRPATIFGEQVSSAIAHGWLDDVYQGLEAEGYAVGAAVLPACSVGAPHRRDRLWFMGHASGAGAAQERGIRQGKGDDPQRGRTGRPARPVAHCADPGLPDRGGPPMERPRAFWAGGEWAECADGKARLIEPSIPLLAYGIPGRVGKLRAYGNAIVPQVAAEFIKAAM